MSRRRISPVVFVWTGRHMIPLPRYKRQCDEQFVIDEEYPLTVLEARSRASHNHYFAALQEAFNNLPEDIAHEFPNSERLRATALIHCGYCDEKTFVCDTEDHALSLASNLMTRSPLCIVTVRENVVKVYDAHSQNAASMGRDEFEKSKAAVLEYCAGLLDTSVKELKKAGAQHFKPEPRKPT